jgi:hypothetical protein
MDRFLKSASQKSQSNFTSLAPAVCVIGRSGIGKTWAVHEALDHYIEITPDILKSKQDTLLFLDKIHGSNTPVVLDEYECVCDLVGIREIKAPPTRGVFIVVSQIPIKFDFEIYIYNFPVPTPEKIKQIFPDASEQSIAESNGDLRHVARSINFKSDRSDEFLSTKDFIARLVGRGSKVPPVDILNHAVSEPGNISSILHENYIDAENINLADAAQHFSDADIIENLVYKGEWQMFPYYIHSGCVLPAKEINHSLGPNLRPGSTWTKYQNACMRWKKLESIINKSPWPVNIEKIYFIRKFIEITDENTATQLLAEYNIEPSDLDVINHMNHHGKIKPKTISLLKKCLANTKKSS